MLRRTARGVQLIAWGRTDLDADIAVAEARETARLDGWEVVGVLRVIGGRASEAMGDIARWPTVRRGRDYDRAFMICEPRPPGGG